MEKSTWLLGHDTFLHSMFFIKKKKGCILFLLFYFIPSIYIYIYIYIYIEREREREREILWISFV
jgi:hypothetical protein